MRVPVTTTSASSPVSEEVADAGVVLGEVCAWLDVEVSCSATASGSKMSVEAAQRRADLFMNPPHKCDLPTLFTRRVLFAAFGSPVKSVCKRHEQIGVDGRDECTGAHIAGRPSWKPAAPGGAAYEAPRLWRRPGRAR